MVRDRAAHRADLEKLDLLGNSPQNGARELLAWLIRGRPRALCGLFTGRILFLLSRCFQINVALVLVQLSVFLRVEI